MAFCNPCVRPANSSIVTYPQRPTSSIKTFLRRQLLKKTASPIIQSQKPIHRSTQNHSHLNARFQRIKGSNLVREVNPITECSFQTNSTNNYDMTMSHDDTELALSRRKSKKIPRWARNSQLQLAIINQVYFNNNNPEEIFGSIHIESVHEMVKSIDFYSNDLLPNFV